MADLKQSPPVVRLVRAKPEHTGAFKLRDIRLMPESMINATDIQVTPEQKATVPYGSLLNYALQLATEWGSEDELVFMIVDFGVSESPTAEDLSEKITAARQDMPNELRMSQRYLGPDAPGEELDPSKLDLSKLPPEVRERFLNMSKEERARHRVVISKPDR